MSQDDKARITELPNNSNNNGKRVVNITTWRQVFPMGTENPLELHRDFFKRKRISNTLIGVGILAFVTSTFIFTIRRMGQDDFDETVDERGYKKANFSKN